MPRAYSDDLRIRIVQAAQQGATCRVVAARFGVSVSTVVRVLARWRSTGGCSPGRMGGSKRHALEGHGALVEKLMAETCDITLEELRLALDAAKIKVSIVAIHRYLKAHDITRKKRQRTPPSRSAKMSLPPASFGAKSNQS